MRFDCEVPGLEKCYVEVSEVWTRAEYKKIIADLATGTIPDEALLGWLRKKLVGCHLAKGDGTFVDDPQQLDEATADQLDLRLGGVLGLCLPQAARELNRLGFRNARLSSTAAAPTAIAEQTSTSPRP